LQRTIISASRSSVMVRIPAETIWTFIKGVPLRYLIGAGAQQGSPDVITEITDLPPSEDVFLQQPIRIVSGPLGPVYTLRCLFRLRQLWGRTGGTEMKRSLLLAISVVALTATSQQIMAADLDAAVPRGRGPAAERAPARERAVRPAPQRTAASQSAASSSSFTGSQAGGFGGGNAGGGSFADPIAFCGEFFPSSSQSLSSSQSCPAVPVAYDFRRRIQGFGGGYYSYSIPLFGWAVIGIQGEIAAGNIRASNTFVESHPTFGGSFVTTSQYSSDFSVGTNGSALIKFGVPIPFGLGTGPGIVTKDGISPNPYSMNSTMQIYGVVGATVARISGSYSYYATQCPAFRPCFNPETAAGNLAFNETRTGVAAGVGIDWIVSPGFVLGIEYRYTGYGNISKDVPLFVTTPGCVGSGCTSSVHIEFNHLRTNDVRVKLGAAF
jgi:opacity protein-like surface antigen